MRWHPASRLRRIRSVRKTTATGANREASARKRLAGWLERHFLVRFHVALILAFSFAVGLLTTRVFFQLGLEAMHWRWPLVLLTAYGAFLLALRVWLSYVGLGRYLEDEKSLDIDVPDIEFSGSSDGGADNSWGISSVLDRSGESIKPGDGGSFGGGGASGDFSALVGGETGDLSGSVSDSASGSISGINLPDIGLPDVGDDGLPLIILGIILALLLAVFGIGFYLIWQAPLLLAEVAFEAAIAAGLVRSVHKVNDPGWVGGALKASWKPFALILAFSMLAAVLAEKYAPDARSLPQAIHLLLR